MEQKTKLIKIFYCYSHKDKRFREELEKHLSALRRSHWVSSWHAGMIEAGEDWKCKVDEQLKLANIILLLISPDFIHSDYCYRIEMKQALARHTLNEARVIPIILRPTDWVDTPFSKLQALPTGGKPLTRWSDRDEAFLDIAQGIRTAAKELLAFQQTKKQWLDEASNLISRKRYEEALIATEYAIQLAPYDVLSYEAKGAVLTHLKRHEQAIEAYDQAIHLDPKSAWVYYSKGLSLLALDRLEEGLAAMEQAITLFPDFSDFHFGKGMALEKLERFEEALVAYDQGILLEVDFNETFVLHTFKGDTFMKLGRFEEALLAYDQAISSNPDYGRAYLGKGSSLIRLSRVTEALPALEQATRLEPDDPIIYVALGHCFSLLQRHEDSLVAFRTTVQLDPSNSKAYHNVGEALYMLHRDEEALAAYEQAIRLDPHATDSFDRKIDTLINLDRNLEVNAVKRAVERVRNDGQEEGNDSRDFSLLGDNTPEQALINCEQILQGNPHDLGSLIVKCVALKELDRYEEACSTYELLKEFHQDLYEGRGVGAGIFKELRSILEISQ